MLPMEDYVIRPNNHTHSEGKFWFWFSAAIVMIATVFVSPWIPFGLCLAGVGLWSAWKYPLWVVFGLTLWWPLESFLLKFVSDDLYVLARYASELGIYAVVATVLIGLYTGRYRLKTAGIEWPFLFFTGTMLCATILHFLPLGEAVLGARQLIRFLLLFFAVVTLNPSREWIKLLIKGWLVMALFQAVIGLGQVVSRGAFDTFLLPSERHTLGEIQLTEGVDQFWEPGQRVFGTMGRYDRFGVFLTLAFLIALAFAYEQPKSRRWYFIAFAIPVLLGILWSYSRSAWLGCLLGIAVIAWIKKDKRALMIGAGIATISVLAILFSGLTKNALDVGSQTLLERLAEGFSYYRFYGEYLGFGRVFWMVQTPLTILPYSWITFLFGWGPGQFGGGAVAALHNTRAYDATGLPFGIYGSEGYVDNNWMSILGENGLIGFVAFVWLFFLLLRMAYRGARTSKDAFVRAMCSAACAALVALALHAGLATFFEIRTSAPFVWILVACAFTLLHQKKESAPSTYAYLTDK